MVATVIEHATKPGMNLNFMHSPLRSELAFRQCEYPKNRPRLRIDDLRGHTVERPWCGRSVSDNDGNVLAPVHAVTHRESVHDIVGADSPQYLAGLVVIGPEVARQISAEDNPTRRRQQCAGDGRALPNAPTRRPIGKSNGVNATYVAVARGIGHACEGHPAVEAA